jgi:hypothetical protein
MEVPSCNSMGSTDIKLNQAVTHRLNGISSANEALQRNIHGHFVGWKLLGGLEHEFDDFPFIGKNQRKLTNIFQRGSNQQPVKILV